MTTFHCSTCGQSHEGLPTDSGFTLPDAVWELAEAERAARARFDQDLCKLDDRYFMRCTLPLPFNYQAGDYRFGPWVEVAEKDFYRYVELFRDDARGDPRIQGKLANAIAAYLEPTLGLAVEVQLQDPKTRPSVHLPADSGHELAQEQRRGIDAARHHAIADRVT